MQTTGDGGVGHILVIYYSMNFLLGCPIAPVCHIKEWAGLGAKFKSCTVGMVNKRN